MPLSANCQKSILSIPVAICCLVAKGSTLLLQVAPPKIDQFKWGFPGGKLEKGESSLRAIQREVKEETGIDRKQSCFEWIAEISLDAFPLIYKAQIFRLEENLPDSVLLSKEHLGFQWVPLEKVTLFPLMKGVAEIVEKYLL